MNIKPIHITDIPDNLKASVYNTEEWLSIYNENLSIYGILNKNNEVIGMFYVYRKKLFKFLTLLTSPPFTPHIGLTYTSQAENKAKKHSVNKEINKSISFFLNKVNANIITLPIPFNKKDTQPFFWNKFKVIPNYTYQIDLTSSIEGLHKNLDPKTRNLIKKGKKSGLTVKQHNNFSLVKEFVMNTMKRNNVIIDQKILHNILFSFSTDKNCFSFITYQEDKPLAVTYCIYDHEMCYYLLGGYNEGAPHSSAGPMAVYESIQHAKSLGLTTFDFEGSMITPIESYFRSFGGKLTPYYTINKANFFLECLLKLKKRNTF